MGYYYSPHNEDGGEDSHVLVYILDAIIFTLVLLVCYVFYRIFEAPVTEVFEERLRKQIQSSGKKKSRKILKAKRALPSKYKKCRKQENAVGVVSSGKLLDAVKKEKRQQSQSPKKKVQWDNPTEQIAYLDDFFQEEKTNPSNDNNDDGYEDKNKERTTRRKMLARKILKAKRLLTSKDKEVDKNNNIILNNDSSKGSPKRYFRWEDLKNTSRASNTTTITTDANIFGIGKSSHLLSKRDSSRKMRWNDLGSILESGTVKKNLSWWEEQLAIPEPERKGKQRSGKNGTE